jgi:hypothetical protein
MPVQSVMVSLSSPSFIFMEVLRSVDFFLDNWLLRAKMPKEWVRRAQLLLLLTRKLGFVLENLVILVLAPKQLFEYLGYSVRPHSASGVGFSHQL